MRCPFLCQSISVMSPPPSLHHCHSNTISHWIDSSSNNILQTHTCCLSLSVYPSLFSLLSPCPPHLSALPPGVDALLQEKSSLSGATTALRTSSSTLLTRKQQSETGRAALLFQTNVLPLLNSGILGCPLLSYVLTSVLSVYKVKLYRNVWMNCFPDQNHAVMR